LAAIAALEIGKKTVIEKIQFQKIERIMSEFNRSFLLDLSFLKIFFCRNRKVAILYKIGKEY
jgi:hypothetical protein